MLVSSSSLISDLPGNVLYFLNFQVYYASNKGLIGVFRCVVRSRFSLFVISIWKQYFCQSIPCIQELKIPSIWPTCPQEKFSVSSLAWLYFKYLAIVVDHIQLSMFTLIVFFMLQYLLITHLILLLLQTRGEGLHIDSSTMYVFCKARLKGPW